MKAALLACLCLSAVIATSHGALSRTAPDRASDSKSRGDALLAATQRGETTFAKRLLQHGAPVDAEDEKGWTPLIYAAKAGNEELVHMLIAKGADVNHRTSTEIGSTALIFAVEGSSMKILRDFLDHGAVVDAPGRNGMTPFIYAAAHGRIEAAKLLLARGADINHFSLIDDAGTTWNALMAAANYEQMPMMRFLYAQGVNLEAKNNKGDTVLMELSKRPHSLPLKFLLDHGANVNARGPRGHTALIYAAYNGMVENVRLLLAAGIDPLATATDEESPNDHYSAEDVAEESRSPEVLALIRTAQARAHEIAPPPPGTRN